MLACVGRLTLGDLRVDARSRWPIGPPGSANWCSLALVDRPPGICGWMPARIGGKWLRALAAIGEQSHRQPLDSEGEPQMRNSSARPLRTMNFVQFSLKRMVEKSDAGIAPQCLQDAVGSSERSQIHCGVLHDWPVADRTGWRTR